MPNDFIKCMVVFDLQYTFIYVVYYYYYYFFFCEIKSQDHGAKKKKSRSSFFSALCVRRASEENLYNGCNKPVANTNRSVTLPALQPFTVNLKSLIKLFKLNAGLRHISHHSIIKARVKQAIHSFN